MMRIAVVFAVLAALAPVAAAQSRLTKELGQKVQTGVGTLTEAQVRKLVPGPVTYTRPAKGGLAMVDADWILTWDETTRVEVTLHDGRLVAAAARFHDTVASKALTPDRFKTLADGMTREEVEKVFGSPTRQSETVDDMNTKTTRMVWSRGREVIAYVKGGVVNGGGFKDTVDP